MKPDQADDLESLSRLCHMPVCISLKISHALLGRSILGLLKM